MTRYKGRQNAKAKTLSANRLRKLLKYAPATGVFRWRVRKGRSNVGTVAGSIHPPKGYRLICIDGKIYPANRLAWLYMTGKWPKLEIGYINHKTSDTRWANLRAMTPSQRGATSRTRNKLGVRGVWITKSGKYVASIKVAGKKKYLGLFDTVEKASVAYARAAKDAFGRFARAR
jgi:hypothetical protein